MRQTILLDGWACEESGTAVGTLEPGMLVEYTSGGNGRQFAANNDAAAAAPASLWVRAQTERNPDSGGSIEDPIAAGEDITVLRPTKGAKINARTNVTTLVRGDAVESAGDGTVRLRTTGAALGICVDEDRIDTSVGAPVGVTPLRRVIITII